MRSAKSLMQFNIVIFLLLISTCVVSGQDQPWRSELYPFSWQKGYKVDNRFLHDFSYAGYHKGELPIPKIEDNILDVTLAPFYADNTGTTDATSAIQLAIDSIATLGSGVVYLPEGTYLISPSNANALLISHDSTVIRGAGADKTFILNTDPYMRSKTIIEFSPGSNGWYSPSGQSINLTKDAVEHDTIFQLSNAGHFETGDLIILTSDFSNEFIAEHQMTGKWNTSIEGTAFARRIVSINESENTIEVDIPIRYYLKQRDNARAYRIRHQLTECGLEDLSIGMIENPKSGFGENDYSVSGTGAYEVHAAHAIKYKYAENCWIRNVNTFKPAANTGDIHVVSNMLELYQSRLISVENCIFQKSQYEGGGGNGYMFTLRGNDCLISHCQAIHSRHNYDFKKAYSNGNVIYKSLSKDSKYASDFHMHLSMSNLFDNHTVDNDFLEAVYRPYGTIEHGHSSTQSVFWNTYGEKYHGNSNRIVASGQWGQGYVIGTQGNATGVSLPTGNNTEPIDHLEGVATGHLLHPASLYEDQLKRRLHGLGSVDSTGWDAPRIDVVSPVVGVQFYTSEVTFELNIMDDANPVNKVIYSDGNHVIAEITEAPFGFTWSGLEEDCYEVTIQAFSQSGTPSNIEIVEFIIGNGCEKSYYGSPFELPGKVEAEYFNKGKNGLSYYDADANNVGGDYRPNEPVDIEKCTEGGFNIGWIADSEFLKYIVEISEDGNYTFSFRVASENSGAINFQLLAQDIAGNIEVPGTNGWQEWQTIQSEPIKLQSGMDTLKLNFTGSFNLNYWEAEKLVTLSEFGPDILFYPNPVESQIHFNFEETPKKIQILALTGKLIDEIRQPEISETMDLSSLNAGIYLIRVTSDESIIVMKMIKN
ncbi:MAG: carbohydrate-binding protein [Marinoscillum sp.]